jgi:hypothetical protein
VAKRWPPGWMSMEKICRPSWRIQDGFSVIISQIALPFTAPNPTASCPAPSRTQNPRNPWRGRPQLRRGRWSGRLEKAWRSGGEFGETRRPESIGGGEGDEEHGRRSRGSWVKKKHEKNESKTKKKLKTNSNEN